MNRREQVQKAVLHALIALAVPSDGGSVVPANNATAIAIADAVMALDQDETVKE